MAEQVIYEVPSLYADHHVVAVRKALADLEGVEETEASAAFQEVRVSYDPKKSSPSAIEERLKEAGYAPGEEGISLPFQSEKGDAAWKSLGLREIHTNPVDLEMSGEFRLY